ncbi:hypothetical protein Emed_006619 [Eimeria media]
MQQHQSLYWKQQQRTVAAQVRTPEQLLSRLTRTAAAAAAAAAAAGGYEDADPCSILKVLVQEKGITVVAHLHNNSPIRKQQEACMRWLRLQQQNTAATEASTAAAATCIGLHTCYSNMLVPPQLGLAATTTTTAAATTATAATTAATADAAATAAESEES